MMRRRTLWTGLALPVAVAGLLAVAGCGEGAREPAGRGDTLADEATPEALQKASYVGSETCGRCHTEEHNGWATTAHTMKLRDGSLRGNYINDSDGNGVADFFDGLDLASTEKFSKFGTNAPVLGSDRSGPYVEIAGTKYYVAYTLGGSGTDTDGDGKVLNEEATWKQRYVTKIGKSHYILPVQYNAQTKEYVTYDESKWYDADGNVVGPPAKNDSYERRCAGCHVTGLEVALEGDEWVMDFADITVGCEACHGPGSRHVAAPAKDNIVNPATLKATKDLNGDGEIDAVDDLVARNTVCYVCHSRGKGKYSAGGTTLSYASRDDGRGNPVLFTPGEDWTEYYEITSDEKDYWGGAFGTDGFLASKSHHQQQQDLDSGPHAPDKPYDHECFVCHDPHSTENPSMVVSERVEDGIRIQIDTSVSDNEAKDNRNNLCLSCHAGHGDFEALTVEAVAAGDPLVAELGKAHMAKYAAKSRADDDTMFACTSCHMPKTAKSAVWYTDESGQVVKGDVASHVLTILWPSLSVANPGMPNSCSGCHNVDEDFDPAESQKDAGTVIMRAWANSGHGDETAEAWKHYDWDSEERQACQKCHTATGAMNYFADPENYDPANNEFELPEGKNQVLYCYGCHSDEPGEDGFGTEPHAPGAIVADYNGPDGEPVTFPDAGHSNVCVMCHAGRSNGQAIHDADGIDGKNFGSFNSHYLAAAGVLYETVGYEFDGRDYTTPAFFKHSEVGGDDGPCVGCHMDGEPKDHSFSVIKTDDAGGKALADVCSTCHAGEFALTVDDLEEEHDAYEAALDVIKDLLAEKEIYYGSGYPYFFTTDKAEDQSFGTAFTAWPDKNTLGAAFNLNLLEREPGAFAHNRMYAKRLIYDSIDWLDDGVLNASVEGTVADNEVVLEYLMGVRAQEPDAAGREAGYIGTAACAQCHPEQYQEFALSGHNYKLNKVTFDSKPTYPFSEIPDASAFGVDGLTDGDNTLGPPTSYADVAYVIGGYGWKARFIDKNGYIVTGADTQYNLPRTDLEGTYPDLGKWVAYDDGVVDKPYDYSCFRCHTTGAEDRNDPENVNPDLPGFGGDRFAMPGIQCERCHGTGAKHANSLDPADIDHPEDEPGNMEASDLCGECHTRDGENRIAASGGLVKHHEQYDEFLRLPIDSAGNVTGAAQGGHYTSGVGCVGCHDPHKTTRYQDVASTGRAIRVECIDCHEGYGDLTVDAMEGEVECEDCHMPRLAKSAVKSDPEGPAPAFGDIRSHIVKVDLSATDQFTADGKFAYPWITRSFACMACHNDAEEPADDATGFTGNMHVSTP